jgi:hypothetical protein
MPATVVDDPLGISCVFSDGDRYVVNMAPAACGELAAELLHGLAGLIHPHGRIDGRGSVTKHVTSVKAFVLWLRDRGFVGGASGLSRAMLAEYWLSLSNSMSRLNASKQESAVRRMLLAFDDDRRVLAADVRHLVSGRLFNPQRVRNRSPLSPYAESEWARIEATCRALTDAAYAEQRQAREGAARGQDPLAGGWTEENVLWLLSQSGPLTKAQVADGAGPGHRGRIRHAGIPQAKAVLFPSTDNVIGYQLLLGVYTGIVPDGIAGLGLGGIDWAGDAAVLIGYVKGRTARESLTLPRKAIRVLEQRLDHSALLRSFAPTGQRTSLWLRYAQECGLLQTAPVVSTALRAWVQRHGLLDDAGQPLQLHRHRSTRCGTGGPGSAAPGPPSTPTTVPEWRATTT